MIQPTSGFPSGKSLTLLSRTLLQPPQCDSSDSLERATLKRELLSLSHDEFDECLALAHTHHVDVRWLEAVLSLTNEETDAAQIKWAEDALAVEQGRIANAVFFLHEIFVGFQERGYDITVIKSL